MLPNIISKNVEGDLSQHLNFLRKNPVFHILNFKTSQSENHQTLFCEKIENPDERYQLIPANTNT